MRHGFLSPATQLAAWLAVAGIAVVYLYALLDGSAIRIAGGRGPADDLPLAGYDVGSVDPQDLVARVETMRQELATLKRRELILETRIADLQEALGPTTSALSSDSGGGAVARSAKTGLRNRVDIARSPLPGDGFGDGLIERSPVPMASSAQPTQTRFGVALGEESTLADLRKRWLALVAKYPPQLKNLEARYASARDGSGLRLIAGPFNNAADAAVLCAKMKTRKLACEQAVFSGHSLEGETPAVPEPNPKRRTN